MGNVLTCECLQGALFSKDELDAVKEKLQALQKGQTFLRSALLGLSSQEVFMKLSEDISKIEWKVVNNTWTANEYGEIDLTCEVKNVKITGNQGLAFISSADGKKVLMEVQAPDSNIRDQWVLSLNELLHDWESHPEHKPKSNLSAAGTSKKEEYFRKREEEIKAREQENLEKKSKYLTTGMKYTAQIMASRQ